MNAANDDPQSPAPKAAGEIGPELQAIAKGLDEVLTEVSGAPVGFMLIVFDPVGIGYVGNANRAIYANAMQKLLAMWQGETPEPSRIILPN